MVLTFVNRACVRQGWVSGKCHNRSSIILNCIWSYIIKSSFCFFTSHVTSTMWYHAFLFLHCKHRMWLTCCRRVFLYNFHSIHAACSPGQNYWNAYQEGCRLICTQKISFNHSALMQLCSHILRTEKIYYKIRLFLHICKPMKKTL